MAQIDALSLAAAVILLIILPCVLLLCLLFDGVARLIERGFDAGIQVAGRAWRAALTGPIGRHWALVRVVRALHLPTQLEPPESLPPPIGQVAADLRRLSRLRDGIATRSSVWFTAIHRAYDDRLQMACAQLEIAQYLDALTGVDLEVERLRLEGELRAAGLVLHDLEADDQHQR